jgi:hypothetical protein
MAMMAIAMLMRSTTAPGRASQLLAACVLLFTVVIPLRPAFAEPKVVNKSVSFVRKNNVVTMSVGFAEMFDAKLKKRLKSGFTTTVVMRVYLYQQGGGQPIAMSARTLRAVYDLWDENFRIKIDEPMGSRRVKLRKLDKTVKKLASFDKYPLVPYALMQPGRRYFVAGIVEVNPMSSEVLAAVRRWLRKPSRRRVGGDSLFGSFVSIFVNDKIRRAAKIYKFRSQPFYRR